MITGDQIRAARAILGWSAEEAAARGATTRQTIQRLEQHKGVPPSRSATLVDLQSAFEAAGVEFVGTADEGPGVRLWASKAQTAPMKKARARKST